MRLHLDVLLNKIIISALEVLLIFDSVMCTRNKSLPFFNDTPTNKTYRVGEVAMLACSVENLDGRTVSWRKASQPQPLSIGNFIYTKNWGISVTHDKSRRVWRLLITNVSRRHAGVYECSISTMTGLRKLFMLRVTGKERPKYMWIKEQPVHNKKASVHVNGTDMVETGQSVHLMCTAIGSESAPQDVDWFHEGEPIDPHAMNDVYITKSISIPDRKLVSKLTIKRSNKDDKGTYICRSTNAKSHKFRVDILNTASSNKKRGSGHINSSFTITVATATYFTYIVQTVLCVNFLTLLVV